MKIGGVIAVTIVALKVFTPIFVNYDFSQFTNRNGLMSQNREVIDMSGFPIVDKDSLEDAICAESARFGTSQVFSTDRENIGAIYPGDHVNPFSQTKYGTAWFQGGIDRYNLVGFNPNTNKCDGTAFFYLE